MRAELFPMSKLLIDEPPLQVLTTLAVKIGLNEAIVLQQLHWLLRDPRHGKRIAEEQWIFNTMEQWVVGYFPFFTVRTMRRIFNSLASQKLVITCQPEGRISRRKYYRIDTERLERITEAAKSALSMGPDCPDGNGPNRTLPITNTSPKTSVQRKVKGSKVFEPRFSYPLSEEEMYSTLELHEAEPNPDYDGNFFSTMTRCRWTIRGEPIWDWIETYRARLQVTSPGGF